MNSAIAIALLAGACSSTKSQAPTQITNSKYYLLDPDEEIETPDPMMRFEKRYHLYGAISRQEQKALEGHYYVFTWSDKERSPATVRLETRQMNTGSKVTTREIDVDRVRRRNHTRFEIIGDEYTIDGKVTAWRVSIVRGGQVVASDQSYLW